MLRSKTCGELRLSDANTTVTLAGWVQTIRDKGVFTTLICWFILLISVAKVSSLQATRRIALSLIHSFALYFR